MKRKHLPRLWCALQGLLPLERATAAETRALVLDPQPKSGLGTKPRDPRRR